MDSQSRGFRLLFRCAGSFNYRPISFTLPITVSLLSYARSLSLSPSHWTLPLSSPPPFFPPYLFLSLTLPGYCPHSLLYHTVITLTPSFFYSFSHTFSPHYTIPSSRPSSPSPCFCTLFTKQLAVPGHALPWLSPISLVKWNFIIF